MADATINGSQAQNAAKDDGHRQGLFSGMKMWFSRAVPGRDWLIQNAELHGAEIVALEKQAHILLVDHKRPNQAPGTTSFQFVEKSIRNGKMEDIDDYAVTVPTRVARAVASTTVAPRGGRAPYTEAEDQFLWNVVRPYMDKGGAWKGNEIYKQVERMNPRHTYQSWRDRWIKYTQHQNRQVTSQVNIDGPPTATQRSTVVPRPASAHLTPPVSQERDGDPILPLMQRVDPPKPSSPKKRLRDDEESVRKLRPPPAPSPFSQRPCTPKDNIPASQSGSPILTPVSQQNPARRQKSIRGETSPVRFAHPHPYGFTDYEAKKLYHATAHLLNFLKKDPADWDDSWEALAASNDYRGKSARQWRNFWEKVILPTWCERRKVSMGDVMDLQYLGHSIGDKAEAAVQAEKDKEGAYYQDQDEDVELVEVRDVVRTEDAEPLQANDNKRSLSTDQEATERHSRRDPSEAPSSPSAIECSKCFTTKTRKWRRDKVGNVLCNECGHFLKSTGLRPSLAFTDNGDENEEDSELLQDPRAGALTTGPPPPPPPIAQTQLAPLAIPKSAQIDAGVQTSPIEPASVPKRHSKSLNPEPQSPTLNRPNSAKKRSTGKDSQSTSHETGKSHSQEEETMPPPLPPGDIVKTLQEQEGREQSLGVTESIAFSRKKRRLEDSPHALEIPSTPEHAASQPESFRLANGQRSLRSPAPLPQKFVTYKASGSKSPLFFPEPEEDDEEDEGGHTPDDETSSAADQEPPVVIDLMDDDDEPEAVASEPQCDDAASEADTASQYAFETAPETGVSRDWETAPEDAVSQRARDKARLETQMLFEVTEDAGEAVDDPFALPEPEGGWEELERSYMEDEMDDVKQPTQGQVESDIVDEEQDDDNGSLPTFNRILRDPHHHISPTADIVTRSPKGKERAVSEPSIPDSAARVSSRSRSPFEEPQTLEKWLEHIHLLHRSSPKPPNKNIDAIASAAVQATSFNFSLATEVVTRMLDVYSVFLSSRSKGLAAAALIRQGVSARIQRDISQNLIPIPEDISGCFTRDDDVLIKSPRTSDWDALVEKHGEQVVRDRVEFLVAWDEA